MPSPIVPKALEPGAKIAFVSPSARLNEMLPAVMERAAAVLRDRGYEVLTLFAKDEGVQSSIANRLSELRTALTDPSVSAVICTIGGSSFTELVPALLRDTELHAAIVVGYSDISGLHWLLYATTGLRTFYGPGAIAELGLPPPPPGDDEAAAASPLTFCVEQLFRAIASQEPLGDIPRSTMYASRLPPYFRDDPASVEPPALTPSPAWTWLRPGKAQGRLFGGCLTVVARLHGITALRPDWRGRIVFLETAVGEDRLSGDRFDRVRCGFADMIADGVFDEAAGLVIGRPYGYRTDKAQQQYAGMIKELLCEGPMAEKPFPILFNVDFGHTTPMVTLPYDALAELDSEKDRFAVLESGVA